MWSSGLPGELLFLKFIFWKRRQQGLTGITDGGRKSVPNTFCRLLQTCRRIWVHGSSEEHLVRSRKGLQNLADSGNSPSVCLLWQKVPVGEGWNCQETVSWQYKPQHAPRCNVIRSPCLQQRMHRKKTEPDGGWRTCRQFIKNGLTPSLVGRGDQEGPLVRDGGFFEGSWGQGFQQDEGSVRHVCGCCGLEAGVSVLSAWH
jgi:hypothetical protein